LNIHTKACLDILLYKSKTSYILKRREYFTFVIFFFLKIRDSVLSKIARVLDCACKIIDFLHARDLPRSLTCPWACLCTCFSARVRPATAIAEHAEGGSGSSQPANFAVASLFGADPRLVHGKYTFFFKKKQKLWLNF
jgi:hypothetical protein